MLTVSSPGSNQRLLLRPRPASLKAMGRHFSSAELDAIQRWKAAGWAPTEIQVRFQRPGGGIGWTVSRKTCHGASPASAQLVHN